MPRYAAFLRGINVGGRKATSDQLRGAFEELGYEDVTTFRASGNVIFDARGKVDGKRVEAALKKVLGYEVASFVRNARELAAIAAHEPFDSRALNASKGKVQVVLASRKPTAAAQTRMRALESDDDRFAFKGRELYWLPSGGLSESAVGMKGITDALGPNTIRTKGTIELIAAKYFGA